MTLLFFSYSHADSELRDQLEKHLAMLKRQGRIDAWHDRKIVAGDSLDDRISEHLEKADIILLLLSSDFLASEYCYGVEVSRALERSQRGEARVIPVVLRPCDWKTGPFGGLLAAPTDGKPVTRWTDRDEAWLDVVEAIKGALPRGQGDDESRQATPGRVSAKSKVLEHPRSSNLRIRKDFSEADRARFLKDAFEFMARFFENSLEELKERHADIESDFTRIDALQFSAVIYRRGKAAGRCRIRLNPSSGAFGSGITFSHDNSDHGGFNESLSVDADDQALFLRPMGMQSRRGGDDSHLSEEGAAELYWEMLIEGLQR